MESTRITMHAVCVSVLMLLVSSLPAAGHYYDGTGTEDDPYQIASVKHLNYLGSHTEDYDKNFVLLTNLDLGTNLPNGKIFQQAVIAPETDAKTDDFQGVPFNGTFNGNGHTIRNLTIENSSGPYIGLFGMIGKEGMVINLSLEDCVIDKPSSSVSRVGAIAGENQGFVFNCSATVKIDVAPNVNYVGGMVGLNRGEMVGCHTAGTVEGHSMLGGLIGYSSGGVCKESSSNCTVNGHKNIGGLIGAADEYAMITCNYAAGDVSGSDCVGGLVGRTLNAVISQCYARGDCEATAGMLRIAGGLVGSMNYTIVENCYSTGKVTPDGGGLIGIRDVTTSQVTGSFWDTNTSGTENSDGSTGLETGRMKKIMTYLGAEWDFATVWDLSEGKTYPFFRWEKKLPTLLRSGASNPLGNL